MDSRSKEDYMELRFVRNGGASQQEKMKTFWRFLDARNELQPQKRASEREPPSETEASSSVSGTEETTTEKDVWREGLKVFRQLGLDKTALAAYNKCRLCAVDRTTRCDDLADTVTQPYEELDADMKAFEQRQKNRSTKRVGTLCVGSGSERDADRHSSKNEKIIS